MAFHHPLENPSLAPYGFAFPTSRKRLEYKPHAGYVNWEARMARQWEKWNRAKAGRPQPIRTIIHEILPGVATANRFTEGDFVFDGLPYRSRDILLLASAVQWFGTNVGHCFFTGATWLPKDVRIFHPEREFTTRFMVETQRSAHRRREWDMVAFFMHECNAGCSAGRGCCIDSSPVTLRDRAVIDGLMRWLGRSEGRAFIAEFESWRTGSQAERARQVLKKAYKSNAA